MKPLVIAHRGHSARYPENTLEAYRAAIAAGADLVETDARLSADGVVIESFQSNHEGQLIDRIQASATENVDFIIINPAGYTHTSVAMRDALAAVEVPYVEVHLSNIHAREPFRHHSYFSDRATGVICGLGAYGYMAALEFALSQLRKT